jgi:hypothetical protein
LVLEGIVAELVAKERDLLAFVLESGELVDAIQDF